ncbi:MAG: hypothetical protein ABIG68_09490, partial [Acidobacteriota bacterium]
MRKKEKAAPQGRRDFLKAAGGMAVAFVAVSGSRADAATPAGQSRASRPGQPMDRGLWITWYDLPEDGRDAYLAWLHETYIPGLLKRPGYLWAAHYAAQEREASSSSQIQHINDPSVPTGYHYILLVGGEDAHVFGDPYPSALNAALPEPGRKMLAMRVGERMNIMVEAGRCEGAGAKDYKDGMTGAPVIQIGSFNCPVEHEEEMHAGYVQLRLPAQCESSSCIRTRKLNSVVGWAKHGILYEYLSL